MTVAGGLAPAIQADGQRLDPSSRLLVHVTLDAIDCLWMRHA